MTIVISGRDLEIVAEALQFRAARLWSEHGLRPSRAAQQLHEAVRQASHGHSDTAGTADRHHECMLITELADLLGVSDRQARRLAPGLDGYRHGRAWHVPRSAVAEHIGGREL